MTNDGSVVRRIAELKELEEARILVDFHQSVEKSRNKSWHDRHIKSKIFTQGDNVLLYDNQYQKHPNKLCMHWLGPFIVVTGESPCRQVDFLLDTRPL
jgi:hypothetical protein